MLSNFFKYLISFFEGSKTLAIISFILGLPILVFLFILFSLFCFPLYLNADDKKGVDNE